MPTILNPNPTFPKQPAIIPNPNLIKTKTKQEKALEYPKIPQPQLQLHLQLQLRLQCQHLAYIDPYKIKFE